MFYYNFGLWRLSLWYLPHSYCLQFHGEIFCFNTLLFMLFDIAKLYDTLIHLWDFYITIIIKIILFWCLLYHYCSIFTLISDQHCIRFWSICWYSCLLIQLVPTKLHKILPGRLVRVVLTYQGNIWETKYNGAHPKYKSFIGSWRAFVDDNKLKVGDALVFELVKDHCSILVFRVRILRGDIPSELLQKVGETEHATVIMD